MVEQNKNQKELHTMKEKKASLEHQIKSIRNDQDVEIRELEKNLEAALQQRPEMEHTDKVKEMEEELVEAQSLIETLYNKLDEAEEVVLEVPPAKTKPKALLVADSNSRNIIPSLTHEVAWTHTEDIYTVEMLSDWLADQENALNDYDLIVIHEGTNDIIHGGGWQTSSKATSKGCTSTQREV